MPFVASAMMEVQSSAVRCAGVRARPARNLALYERASLTKSALLVAVVCESQSTGIGKPLVPLDAAALLAMAMAESTLWSATSMTSDDFDNPGITSEGTAAVMMAAES